MAYQVTLALETDGLRLRCRVDKADAITIHIFTGTTDFINKRDQNCGR